MFPVSVDEDILHRQRAHCVLETPGLAIQTLDAYNSIQELLLACCFYAEKVLCQSQMFKKNVHTKFTFRPEMLSYCTYPLIMLMVFVIDKFTRCCSFHVFNKAVLYIAE